MSCTKPRRFWFHYNKPESRRLKHPVISLHFKGTCHLLDDLTVAPATKAKFRKRQPYFVMEGFADQVAINEGKAIVL